MVGVQSSVFQADDEKEGYDKANIKEKTSKGLVGTSLRIFGLLSLLTFTGKTTTIENRKRRPRKKTFNAPKRDHERRQSHMQPGRKGGSKLSTTKKKTSRQQ